MITPQFAPPAPGTDAPGSGYVFSRQTELAVNVALAVNRPLLITGNPGSGKTSLARTVAEILGWRFLEMTITSRTQLEALQADMDLLRRLADAQTDDLQPDWTYLKPGILWWAFDRVSARRRGASDAQIAKLKKQPPELAEPGGDGGAGGAAVLLLDEIDKADPDLPNDLLRPFDLREFDLPTGGKVAAKPLASLLMVFTSNGERELPAAFVRRCVTLDLPDALPEEKAKLQGDMQSGVCLEAIAARRFAGRPHVDRFFIDVANCIQEMRDDPARRGLRPPSTAEYLDTLEVLARYPAYREQEDIWRQVRALVLDKAARPTG